VSFPARIFYHKNNKTKFLFDLKNIPHFGVGGSSYFVLVSGYIKIILFNTQIILFDFSSSNMWQIRTKISISPILRTTLNVNKRLKQKKN
jgi:hypothetical protein